jgi:hypothetical protein
MGDICCFRQNLISPNFNRHYQCGLKSRVLALNGVLPSLAIGEGAGALICSVTEAVKRGTNRPPALTGAAHDASLRPLQLLVYSTVQCRKLLGTVYNFVHVPYSIPGYTAWAFSLFILAFSLRNTLKSRTSNGNGANNQKLKWQPKNIKHRLRCRRQISLRAIMLVSVLSMMGAAAVSASS